MAVYGKQSSPDVSYSTWHHDEQVEFKISSFDPQNPLGISTCMNWIIHLYLPVLVVAVIVTNLFSIWVLQSPLLRRLVIQPLISMLLYLHIFLTMVGPLYVWLVQVFRIHFARNQIYPCFLLLWGHNFAMTASAYILVSMVIERAFSIGKPEVFWGVYQKGCRNTVGLMLVVTLVVAVGGLMCVDVTVELQSEAYPICMPWWSNEHSSVSSIWYKFTAVSFSLVPTVLMLLSLLLLRLAVKKFERAMRTSIQTLNHYNALYLVEILHMKFVKSVSLLGLLFIIVCLPLGFFIIFGPVIYSTLSKRNFGLTPLTNDSFPMPVTEDVAFEESQRQYVELRTNISDRRMFWEHSYLLVSRSDAEAMLWLWYYSFPLFVVPILSSTEVLFRQEWNKQLLQVARCLNCRGKRNRPWTGSSTDGQEGRDFKCPYITLINHLAKQKQGAVSQKKPQNIKVYKAGKAVRAGREVEGSRVDSRKCHGALTSGNSVSVEESEMLSSTSTEEIDPVQFSANVDINVIILKLILAHRAIGNESPEQKHREICTTV